MRACVAVAACVALLAGPFAPAAQASGVPPTILTYQGRLTDSGGNLLGGAGTNYYMKFSIWDSPTVGSGNRVWPTNGPATTTVSVAQGVFTVNIGDTANGYPDALNLNFANNSSLYLQVEVSSDNVSSETLSPRQQLTSAVFAQVAGAIVGTTTASLFGTTTPVSSSFVTVQATSSNTVPLSIAGASGQSANLFQILSSNLSSLFSVSGSGALSVSGLSTLTGGFLSAASSTVNGNFVVTGTATTSKLAVTGVTSSLLKTNSLGQLVAAVAGTDYSNFAYLFPSNATSTALTFSGGLLSTASTTVNADLKVSGNVGIGTTTPGSLLSVGDTGGINFTTATSTFSTTGGINLASGCFAVAGTCISGGTGSLAFSYPFPSNATSTKLTFSGGLLSTASTTIGNGTATGGLTVSGNATTTGSAYFAGNVGIGAQAPGAMLDLGIGSSWTANNVQAIFTRGQDNNFQLYAANGANANTTGTVEATFGLRYAGSGDAATLSFIRGSSTLNSSLAFNTNGSERLRITNSGTIGIGTTTPYGLLSVNPSGLGSAPAFVVGSSTQTLFKVNNTGETAIWGEPLSGIGLTVYPQNSGVNSLLDIARESNFLGAFLEFNPAGTFTSSNVQWLMGMSGGTNNYSFSYWDGGSVTNVFNITNTGYSGMGTTSPWGRLSVDSSNLGSNPAFVVGSSTNTSFVVDNGGNIGIGTAAPTSPVTILKGVNKLCIDPTSAQTFTMCAGGGSIGFSALAQVQFYTNNIQQMTIDSAGNVGIGTTTPYGLLSVNPNGISGPAFVVGSSTQTNFIITKGGNVGIGNANPTSALEVNGAITLDGNNPLNINTNGALSYQQTYAGNGGNDTVLFDNGSNEYLTLETHGASPITFLTNSTESMRITAGGNVGIGTSTPGSLLSINGIANFTAATSTFYGTGGINLSGGCFAVNGSCISGGTGSGASLSAANTWTAIQTFSAGASTTQLSVTGGYVDYSGAATKNIIKNNTANAWTLATSTSATPLISVDTTTGSELVTLGSGFSNYVTVDPGIKFGVGSSTPFANLSIHANAGATNTTLFAIGSSTASATSTLFSVDNTGLTTVGNSSGTGDAVFQFAGDTNAWAIGYKSSDKSFNIASSTNLSGTAALSIAKNGNTTIAGSGTTCVIGSGTGATSCTSDERLKTNISQLSGQDALDKLALINGVTFNWADKTKDQNQQLGVIAQNVLEAFPQLVGSTTVNFNGVPGTYYTVDYAGLTAPLISGVNELHFDLEAIASSTASTTPQNALDFAQGFFNNLFSRLSSWFADRANNIGKFFAREVHTDTLCVAKSDGTEVCLTGDQVAAIAAGESAAGTTQQQTQQTSTTTQETSGPIISVNGNNPASIAVGSIYSDLGAAITGPVADLNLGVHATVDGGATTTPEQISIDTSSAGTHTILYFATDQNGVTGYATRSVVVYEPAAATSTATTTPSVPQQGGSATSTPPGIDTSISTSTATTTP